MKELIKKIRTSLNMSQAELAELLNLSFATVNRWENGHAVPNKLAQSTLYELCKANNTLAKLQPKKIKTHRLKSAINDVTDLNIYIIKFFSCFI